MSIVIDNLKKYLQYKNISTSRAENSIGLSNGTLAKPFSKGTSIKTSTLEAFLNVYSDLNPTWLFTNRGQMIDDGLIHANEPLPNYEVHVDLKAHEKLDELLSQNKAIMKFLRQK